MKKFSKILALAVAVLTVMAIFSGCKKNSKVLTVATNAEFEPFESLDSDNNVVGFDADLIKLIADEMGMTVKFSNMEFDGVIAAVTSGTCDSAISGLTINAKRSKSVDFSDAYYEGAAQILIVKTDDTTYTGTTKAELDNQLKNKTIGVCSGYTGQAYAQGDEDWGFEAIEGATVKIYDNPSLAIADLKSGTISAIILDDSVAKENVASTDGVKTIDVPLTIESYGIAVKKGDSELLSKINSALAKIKESGKLDELKTTWKVN